MTNGSVFTHGVASGDVTCDGVVLWTRLDCSDAAPIRVEWRLRPVGAVGWARCGRTVAASDGDGTCHVVVDGLEPGTRYEFEFVAAGETIGGRTATLPRRAEHLRIAVACCSRWGWPGFDRYATILDEEPDVVVHLGDFIYEIGETTPVGGRTDPPYECRSLEDYRRRYRQHRSHASLRELLASVPMVVVWDDHEIVDNAPGFDAARRRAGRQAWREWMPTRATPDDAALDRRITVDGLVDLTLVDARFRGRVPNDSGGPSTSGTPGPILAPDQWRLLEAAVATSTTPWFVVANQVHVSPMTLAYLPATRWPPWRRLINPDQWDGFPAERDRLAALLERAAGRPVVVSGDLHAGWSREMIVGGRTVAHELTCPSMSGVSFAAAVRGQTWLPRRLLERIVRRLNPGIDHLDTERHGFLVCDITPEEFRTTFVHHDGSRVERRLVAGRRPVHSPGRRRRRDRDVAQPG